MVVGRDVYSTEYTTYSSTIKYMSMRIMIFIAVKNGLGLMVGDIGNSLCTSPCAENIWSCFGADFFPICIAVVFIKRALYVLSTA